jgi:hypothetical protein
MWTAWTAAAPLYHSSRIGAGYQVRTGDIQLGKKPRPFLAVSARHEIVTVQQLDVTGRDLTVQPVSSQVVGKVVGESEVEFHTRTV